MLRIFAITAIVIAGIIHLVIAPNHYNHAPAHGIFFALSGIAELGWAFVFWRWSNRMTYYAGLALSGGLIVLWIATQIFGAPFGDGPEPLDAGAVGSKLAELIGFGALLWLGMGQAMPAINLSRMPRLLAEAFVLALVFGLASYSAGYAVEPMMPGLHHVGDDHHEGDDDHGDSGHHDDDDDHGEKADDHHNDDNDDHHDNDQPADHHDDDEDDHHANEDTDHHDDDDGHHSDDDDHHNDDKSES